MAAAVRALTDANTTATVSERRTQGCTVWLQKQIAVTLTNVVIFLQFAFSQSKVSAQRIEKELTAWS